ncbi:MAG: hypothetical protein ACJAZW_001420 [Maritalea sp.]|jgi:hypothetical protein
MRDFVQQPPLTKKRHIHLPQQHTQQYTCKRLKYIVRKCSIIIANTPTENILPHDKTYILNFFAPRLPINFVLLRITTTGLSFAKSLHSSLPHNILHQTNSSVRNHVCHRQTKLP